MTYDLLLLLLAVVFILGFIVFVLEITWTLFFITTVAVIFIFWLSTTRY
jgi:hypothetical protein